MPVQPLVDLDSLDLSTVLHDRESLDSVLKQRGTFAMVDGVLHLDLEGDLVVGYKDIRKDDWWAKDHIPGRPIFPGALMVEASAQLGSFDYFQRRPEELGAFIGFIGIDKTRFRQVVEPDCPMYLVGRVHRMRRTMFSYRFQGWVEKELAFEAEITGMQV